MLKKRYASNRECVSRAGSFVSCMTGAMLVVTSILLSAPNAVAQSTTVEFNIPAQPVSSALRAYAHQAKVQLLVLTEGLNTIQANTVLGRLDPRTALQMLLAGTGLQAEYRPDATVAVGRGSDTAGPVTSASGDARHGQASLLTQARQEPGEAVMIAQAMVDQNQTSRRTGTDSGEGEEKRPLEEIIVTGTNIRGIAPESSPLDVYEKADVQALGATNMREFLLRVPQNLSASTSVAGDEIFRQSNRNQINSPDLRGLGQGSTLVLLNGRRLPLSNEGSAVDVSLIPVAALDRVEVLSDGASSIYGTDAVGGVVNFILEDEFDGAVTTISGTTVTKGGYKSGEFNQLLGKNWNSGNVLGSVTATSVSQLTAEDRDFATLSPRYLSPVEQGYSAFLTGHQDLGERVKLFGDFLYTDRNVKSVRRQLNDNTLVLNDDVKQYFATAGINTTLTEQLSLEFVSSYALAKNISESIRFNDDGTSGRDFFDEPYESLEFIAKIDGALFEIGGNTIQFALGGGRFSENFERIRDLNGTISGDGITFERDTNYVFGEIQIPLVSQDHNFPLARRIEVNASGRYTDTSDAGHSIDPKIGVLWEFNNSFQIRGTYSTSFRAPRLFQIAPGDVTVFILSVDSFGLNFPDPFTNDRSTVYFQLNQETNENLIPESAESFTAGLDVTPSFASGLSISGTYFNIAYTDRIDVPAGDILGALGEPDLFAAVIRDATLQEISTALSRTNLLLDFSGNGLSTDSTPEEIIAVTNKVFDLGIANISSLKTTGFDLSADYQKTTRIGDISVGGALTYLLKSEQRLTASSPIDERLDTITNPIDLRFRTYIGLSKGGWRGRINVNYIDSYKNIPESGQNKIRSWTTVDLVTSYVFSKQLKGPMSGAEIHLGVRNLFNEDPPFVANAFSGVTLPIGFDPANANPFGTLVTVQLVKKW